MIRKVGLIWQRLSRILICLFLFAISLQASGQVVTAMVPASGWVFDPVSKKIWACVGSAGAGPMANSIVSIDPETGAVGAPVFIGSEPVGIVLSDKSKYLYVVVSDGRSIRRFDLATQKPGPQFPVGDGLAVTRMLPAPGNADAVIVMRHRPGISPNDAGVAIYENGIAKPGVANAGHHLTTGISPLRMYGYENQISTWAFTALNSTKDGITAGASGSLIGGNVGLSGTANGLVITNNGGVLDPESRETAGRLPNTGLEAILLPDGSTGKVYQFTGDGNQVKVTVFDLQRFVVMGEFTVRNLGGKSGPSGPIRWGDTGLAFGVGDRIVILKGAVGPLLPKADLSVKREMPNLATGSAVNYTLTVSNIGPAPSTGAFLTDVLPKGAEVLSIKSSQGSAVFSTGVVRAELGEMAVGAKATVTVRLQLNSAEDRTFTAVVRGHQPDPATENNIDLLAPAAEASNLPDLTASWERLSQVAEGAGANLKAYVVGEVAIRNNGRQPSEPCTVRFYLSGYPTFRAISSQLLQENQLPSIPKGKVYYQRLEAPLGSGDDATGLFVFAVVDPTDRIRESDKRNNVVRAVIR